MIKLGTSVFYIDQNTKKVLNSEVRALGVSGGVKESWGYLLYDIIGANKPVEESLIFNSKEEADNRAAIIFPLQDKADKIIEKAKQDVDAIRKEILGQPNKEYIDLAAKIVGSK